MQVYRLTPNPDNLDNESWKASRHNGEIVMCAETEGAARMMAETATVQLTDATNGVIYPPWNDKDLVSCEVTNDYELPDEVGVIEPATLKGREMR